MPDVPFDTFGYWRKKTFRKFRRNTIYSPQQIHVPSVDAVRSAFNRCGLVYCGDSVFYSSTDSDDSKIKRGVDLLYRGAGVLGYFLDRVKVTVTELKDGTVTANIIGRGREEFLIRVKHFLAHRKSQSELMIPYENIWIE